MKPHRLPQLPSRGRSGHRPAAAFILASIARDIIADRKSAGLTPKICTKLANTDILPTAADGVRR